MSNALMQWSPFREMDEMFSRFQRSLGRMPGNGNESTMANWLPVVDISEKDKEYLLKVELPGVKKEDLKIELRNGVLSLSGERKVEKEDKGETYHRVERAYGSFSRSFSLPDNVTSEKIEADCKDGVVYVHLPKTEAKKSAVKQIPIN